MTDTSQPFVSIVVPFYNVEGCVDYCMKSLLAQTYEDFEIVCVDDGSTDRTLQYLSKYESDARIHLFTKENGGLSDARNFGVAQSRGQYISFVDGDDVVSPYYLEALTSSLRQSKDQLRRPLIAGRARSINLSEVHNLKWSHESHGKEIDRASFLEMLLYDEITESAWAKLAPRDLYREILFPLGQKYEDLATITSFVQKTDSFFVLDSEIYGYVQRGHSIVHTSHPEKSQITDYLTALHDFEMHMPNDDLYTSGVIYRHALSFARIHELISRMPSAPQSLQSLDQTHLRYIRQNIKAIIGNRRVRLSMKIRLFVISISPKMHDTLIVGYRQAQSLIWRLRYS